MKGFCYLQGLLFSIVAAFIGIAVFDLHVLQYIILVVLLNIGNFFIGAGGEL